MKQTARNYAPPMPRCWRGRGTPTRAAFPEPLAKRQGRCQPARPLAHLGGRNTPHRGRFRLGPSAWRGARWRPQTESLGLLHVAYSHRPQPAAALRSESPAGETLGKDPGNWQARPLACQQRRCGRLALAAGSPSRQNRAVEIASTYCPHVPVLSPPLSPPAMQAHPSAPNPHGYWALAPSGCRMARPVPVSPPLLHARSPRAAPPNHHDSAWAWHRPPAQREEKPARAPPRAQQKGPAGPLGVSWVCRTSGSAARHWDHLCALPQAFQVVRPCLHHVPALVEVLRAVVGTPQGIRHRVG